MIDDHRGLVPLACASWLLSFVAMDSVCLQWLSRQKFATKVVSCCGRPHEGLQHKSSESFAVAIIMLVGSSPGFQVVLGESLKFS